MNKGIQNFFTGLAPSYELINRIITLGLDSAWRKRAINSALDCPGDNRAYLDICTGTGQMARLLAEKKGEDSLIAAADFSLPMLRHARENTPPGTVAFNLGDALHLPYGDDTFDLVTIGFATRNLCALDHQLVPAFREFHRVLKPGGCFINLETSQPASPLLRGAFHLYVKLTVRPVGRLVSGTGGGYNYLSNSIRTFYNAAQLQEKILSAGFSRVEYRKLLFGVAAIHLAVK